MKNILSILVFIFLSLTTKGQSWNPYVNQGNIEPAPVLPLEFEGNGEVLFNIGNSGSTVIEYDKFNPENNLILIVSLQNVIPNKNNPIAALRGNWKGKFSWTYDESTTSFVGIQKTDISGYAQGNLGVVYKVSDNASILGGGPGFNVEIIGPAYMAGYNHSADDKVSSYTYTRAYDQGDAPASYGAAIHEINFNKDAYSGDYNKYLYLGESVDQESLALASEGANGDDNDNLDDEDGVLFPELIAGISVSIPIVATVEGTSWGILNAWFDWNGDGDFMDAGEKVTEVPTLVFTSGTYNLSVSIPEDAVTSRHTYARFRLGGNSGPTSINPWGEVEDYSIQIESSNLIVEVDKQDVSIPGGSDGWISLQVSGGTQPYEYLWDNGLDKKFIRNLKAGDYGVTIRDANNISINRIISIYEPSISWENKVVLLGQKENSDVVLIWHTEKEQNTAWFIVERSIDGSEFKQIGNRIDAAGDTKKRSNYTFTDSNVEGEIVSYRVKLMERNNQEIVSNTITKILDSNSFLAVGLFPNPVVEVYRVKIDRKGSYLLELMDMSGRIVSTSTMEVNDNKVEQTMYRNGIMNGQYILRVTDKSNLETRTLKVLMSELESVKK